MASSLQQFSNVGPSSKEEIQQEVQSNDGRKFELWPEHQKLSSRNFEGFLFDFIYFLCYYIKILQPKGLKLEAPYVYVP